VKTTGNQTYNDTVNIANNPILTGNGITFNNTVNGNSNGNSNLTANATTGKLTFEKTVGTSNLTASGNIIDIKDDITTNDLQTYTGAVNLFKKYYINRKWNYI